MLLPREHLALSHLDLALPSGDFEYARQYESTVKILDLESRMGNRPVVLVARMESNKSVYVMERQESNLYTLCRMGNWVDLEKLSLHATVAYSKLLKHRSVVVDAMHSEATTTPQLHKDNKKRRLAMEAIQSLVKRPARSQSISLSSQATGAIQDSADDIGKQGAKAVDNSASISGDRAENAATAPTAVPALDQVSAPRTAEAIFENVRSQYFEALYRSMVRLLLTLHSRILICPRGPLHTSQKVHYLERGLPSIWIATQTLI